MFAELWFYLQWKWWCAHQRLLADIAEREELQHIRWANALEKAAEFERNLNGV